MTRCSCEGLSGLELAVCLAPPRGEYETEVRISDNVKIIVNRDGVYLRRVVTDDTLPFVHTVDKPAREETLRAYNVSVESIICENVRNLRRAASAGSRVAAGLVEACGELIRALEEKCGETT